jgi:tetratricopeptide (TPR) repeat protein
MRKISWVLLAALFVASALAAAEPKAPEANPSAAAEAQLRKALAADEKKLGVESPKLVLTLGMLATLLEETGRPAEAEPFRRRALAIEEKKLGPENPMLIGHLDALAQLLRATGRNAEAEPLLRRALAIAEKSYGPEDTIVASALLNLGLSLQEAGNLTEAEPLVRRSLSILIAVQRMTGTELPSFPGASQSYVALLQSTGKTEEEAQAALQALIEPQALTEPPG